MLVHRYGSIKVRRFESYCSVRVVHTGPPVDRYVNRRLLGFTANWGCFLPVTTRNQLVTVDFDRCRPISGDIRGRKKKREKKKRKKKRENLEIRRCSSDPNLSLAGFLVFREEKKTMRDAGFACSFLLPA
ncbi:hypothetical protein B296_00050650 [Ensete ventricosum]|uniref:Uncharacterized protein n=1 Tax=Ensete ventricosum TaxID=4639 RepID=A0A426Y6K4_ENSVE|nr:hypothetical protein B296_00050650 [Ensete ventricosum]